MTYRLRVVPRFPANISGADGITVERDGVDLVIKPDYGALVQTPAVVDPDASFFQIWQRDEDMYVIMSLTDVFTVGGALYFMPIATYDPQGIEADAFALANMTGTVSTAQIADGAISAPKLSSSLPVVRVDTAQSFTATQQAQARTNIDVVQAGYKSGMVLSNNASDVNNDIDISAGVRMADNGSNWLRLASTLTKQLDAAWAVGSNAGMLDTGSKANSESYALFVIGGAAVATDVLASTSFSAPTMPTGYTWKRYLGTIVTSSSGNIFSFSQIGNYFRRLTITGGSYSGTIGTTSSLASLSIPRGISCQIDLQWRTLNASGNGFVYLRHPDDTDISVAGPASANLGGVGTNVSFVGTVSVFSDTSRQVAARAFLASTTLELSIRGWTDPYL